MKSIRPKISEKLLWLGILPVLFIISGIFLYFYEFTPVYIKFSYCLLYAISLVLYFAFLLISSKSFKS